MKVCCVFCAHGLHFINCRKEEVNVTLFLSFGLWTLNFNEITPPLPRCSSRASRRSLSSEPVAWRRFLIVASEKNPESSFPLETHSMASSALNRHIPAQLGETTDSLSQTQHRCAAAWGTYRAIYITARCSFFFSRRLTFVLWNIQLYVFLGKVGFNTFLEITAAGDVRVLFLLFPGYKVVSSCSLDQNNTGPDRHHL